MRVKVFAIVAVLSMVIVSLAHPTTSFALGPDSLADRGCKAGAPNLVQNPGFETVTDGSQTWGGWILAYNLGGVPGWNGGSPILDPTEQQYYGLAGLHPYSPTVSGPGAQQPLIPPSGLIGHGLLSTANPQVYTGSYAATLNGFHPQYHLAGAQAHGGLFGTLTTPVTPGVTYRLSARIHKDDQAGSPPASIAMSLQDSQDSSGNYNAESVASVRASVNDPASWTLLTGTVTAGASYDHVLFRYYQDGDWAAIDDVVVCEAASISTSWSNWLLHNLLGPVLAGLGLAGITLLGGFVFGGTRRGKVGGSSKHKRVAVGDLNGDGKPDLMTSSSSQSATPLDRVFLSKKKIVILAVVIGVVGGGCVYIFDRWGNSVFKGEDTPTSSISAPANNAAANNVVSNTTTNTTTTNSTNNTVANTTTTPTPTTPAPAKTCTDVEKLKSGYKLFRNETDKYCIQYPNGWKVDSKNLAEVTFGTVPTAEPGPGWFKVKYFTGKSMTTRTEEIKNIFREPAGPCTTSNVTIAGTSGKKLACIGAASGETNVFYLVPEEKDLIELSYVEGMGENKASYETQYKNMVDSFLCDMFVNK